MKPLVTYFVLAYILSWTIWLPLYGHVVGLADLPVLPLHHGLGGLGPLIASVVTTCVYQKHVGLKLLLKQCLKVRPVLYFLVALTGPFVLAVLASVISYFVDGTPIELSGLLTTNEFPEFNLAAFFLYNLVFFGFGEEMGWRGFALPRLQKRFTALTATLVLTVLWAVWHWPLFFYRPGYTTMDVAGIFGWVFFSTASAARITMFRL